MIKSKRDSNTSSSYVVVVVATDYGREPKTKKLSRKKFSYPFGSFLKVASLCAVVVVFPCSNPTREVNGITLYEIIIGDEDIVLTGSLSKNASGGPFNLSM